MKYSILVEKLINWLQAKEIPSNRIAKNQPIKMVRAVREVGEKLKMANSLNLGSYLNNNKTKVLC